MGAANFTAKLKLNVQARAASAMSGTSIASEETNRAQSRQGGAGFEKVNFNGFEREHKGERKKLVQVGPLLLAGACFGEISLQTGEPRKLTAVALEPVFLAILSRNDYMATLKASMEKNQQGRINFMRSIPLFSSLMESVVSKLAMILQPRAYVKNEILVDVGSPAIQVFLVREGQFAVCSRLQGADSVDVDQQPTGPPKEEPEPSSPTAGAVRRRPLAGKTPANPASGQNPEPGPGLAASAAVREWSKKETYLTVALLAEGSVLGATSYLRGEKCHRLRVVCQSAVGSVFSLLAKEWANYLSKEQRAALSDMSQTQELYYENRLTVLRRIQESKVNHVEAQGLASPMILKGNRFWREETTLSQRLQTPQSKDSVYSARGRLRTITQAFEQKAADTSPGASPRRRGAPQTPAQAQDEPKPEEPVLRPCWLMETMANTNNRETSLADPWAPGRRVFPPLQDPPVELDHMPAEVQRAVFHVKRRAPKAVLPTRKGAMGNSSPTSPTAPVFFSHARTVQNGSMMEAFYEPLEELPSTLLRRQRKAVVGIEFNLQPEQDLITLTPAMQELSGFVISSGTPKSPTGLRSPSAPATPKTPKTPRALSKAASLSFEASLLCSPELPFDVDDDAGSLQEVVQVMPEDPFKASTPSRARSKAARALSNESWTGSESSKQAQSKILPELSHLGLKDSGIFSESLIAAVKSLSYNENFLHDMAFSLAHKADADHVEDFSWAHFTSWAKELFSPDVMDLLKPQTALGTKLKHEELHWKTASGTWGSTRMSWWTERTRSPAQDTAVQSESVFSSTMLPSSKAKPRQHLRPPDTNRVAKPAAKAG